MSGAKPTGNHALFTCLLKIDTLKLSDSSENNNKQACKYYWPENGGIPAEPVFVKNPTGIDEDDGVIISVVLDKKSEESYMVVLDAKTMQETYRAYIGTVMNFNFHGDFKRT